jgi:Lon protease-like protein
MPEFVFVLLPLFALGLVSLLIGGSIALVVFAPRYAARAISTLEPPG